MIKVSVCPRGGRLVCASWHDMCRCIGDRKNEKLIAYKSLGDQFLFEFVFEPVAKS